MLDYIICIYTPRRWNISIRNYDYQKSQDWLFYKLFDHFRFLFGKLKFTNWDFMSIKTLISSAKKNTIHLAAEKLESTVTEWTESKANLTVSWTVRSLEQMDPNITEKTKYAK